MRALIIIILSPRLILPIIGAGIKIYVKIKTSTQKIALKTNLFVLKKKKKNTTFLDCKIL